MSEESPPAALLSDPVKANLVNSQQTTLVSDTAASEQFLRVAEVYVNASQKVLVTTEDRLKLRLVEHARRVETSNGWIAPLGIFAALVTSLATADFRSFIFPAATWQAFFLFAAVASGIWLFRAVWVAVRTRTDVDTLIAEIKIDEPVKRKVKKAVRSRTEPLS